MSGKGTLKSFKAMMAEARLPERTVELCLRGDLIADFQALEAELDAARNASPDSLDSGTGEILERMDTVQALMRESTYPVRLRALPGPEFRALVAQHPPRQDADGAVVEDDRGVNVNSETFWEPLLRACLVDPDLTTSEWREFVDGITDYQFTELAVTSLTLNRGRVDIPFSLAASQMKQASGGE